MIDQCNINFIIYLHKINTMKKIQDPPFLYSKSISSLNQQKMPLEIDIDQVYPFVIPRIFPNPKVPLKVAVNRKVKEFSSFDLNTQLSGIEWDFQKANLSLTNFIYLPEMITDLGCTEENIKEEKVFGRAFDGTSYKKFKVKKKQGQYYEGQFQEQTNKNKQILHRSLICFDFEDPIEYAEEIFTAEKRRQKIVNHIKYEFYIDNIDLEEAPQPNSKLLSKIKYFMNRGNEDSFPFLSGEKKEISDHYKRVMNELMFRKQVQEYEMDIYVPNKYRLKEKKNLPLKKQIRMQKNNKVFKLIPKSMEAKKKDLQSKSILINDNITEILLQIKQKLVGDITTFSLFYESESYSAIEKFTANQEKSISIAYSALNEYLIDPISSQLRHHLVENSDGWFRLYENERSTYEGSKLKRLFILIETMIKDNIRDKLKNDFEKYTKYLRESIPSTTTALSISSAKSNYRKGFEYPSLLIVEIQLQKSHLKLSHSFEKISSQFQRLIFLAINKFRSIPSPEPIVLKQIFGGYKNQEGIKLNLPYALAYEPEQKWIGKLIQQVLNLFREGSECLKDYEALIKVTEEVIQLQNLLVYEGQSYLQIDEIIERFSSLKNIEENIMKIFDGNGLKLGMFYVQYGKVKKQLLDTVESAKNNLKRQVLKKAKVINDNFNLQITELREYFNRKSLNLSQLTQKESKIENLPSIIESFKYTEMEYTFNLCAEYGCQIQIVDARKRWENEKIIKSLEKAKDLFKKEFEQVKREEMRKMRIEYTDIEENLMMLQITKNSFYNDIDLAKAKEYEANVDHVRKRLQITKKAVFRIIESCKTLKISEKDGYDFENLRDFEVQFIPLELLWKGYSKWKYWHQIWMYETIGSFQLHNPEEIIKNLKHDLHKCTTIFEKKSLSKLREISSDLYQEIQDFQDKLQLLKLLKKQGFNKTHFIQIGIPLEVQVEHLTLAEAIKMNFMDKMKQIQAISNDAWNQYSLEQTLERVKKQLWNLKYEINFYLDKKKNKIPMIINYQQLIVETDQILNNLESVQFNPMKKMFIEEIVDIFQRSRYISKSVCICQQFQKIFIQIHPIFDSTDIAKQIPMQNKKFAKIMRIWLQLLNYLKSVGSVHDSCNNQNIFEKVRNLLSGIEKIKKELSHYLQTKRKGFGRFYLLSNSEMFELYSSTSEISNVISLIPKLFDSVCDLQVSNGFIEAVKTLFCSLRLTKRVLYKNINIENWMNELERQIKNSIMNQIGSFMKGRYEDWLGSLENYCKDYVPQILYLCYDIYTTSSLSPNQSKLKNFIKKQTQLLLGLVQQQKSYNSEGKNNTLLDTTSKSLIIMIIGKIDLAKKLLQSQVTNQSDFQWKKFIKFKYLPQTDSNFQKVNISILNFTKQYGCEFLGSFPRLVFTNLTERTQVIYMLAFQYSLCCSALGPAGTGKSQTTKDIAKINGQICFVYNCSKEMELHTINRLLKGMVITGIWMCFQEFNRLHFRVLAFIGEQLSTILKFRSFGHKIQVNFYQDIITVNPKFQFCTTYNPDYESRRQIPKTLQGLFRSVAMINVDESIICKSLLFAYGYQRGEVLAQKTTSFFKLCRYKWINDTSYDFGLRALRGVIDLAAKKFLSGEENEENSIITSLLIMMTINMKKIDKDEFEEALCQFFPSFIRTNRQSQATEDLCQVLHIRNSVIMFGEPLSGKNHLIKNFKEKYEDWEIYSLYQDNMYVSDLYGTMDPTTKLWTDGYFTKYLRSKLNSSQKNLVVFNGSIHSEWVENLNSFLDSTRKLSLSSGQNLSIPKYFKLLMVCLDLKKATPATITRSSVLFCQPLTIKQLANTFKPQISFKYVKFFQELQDVIKNSVKIQIEPRLVLFWSLTFHGKKSMTYDSFIFFLTLVYRGILTDAGRNQYTKYCQPYLSLPISPFEIQLRQNNEICSLDEAFKESLKYEEEDFFQIENKPDSQQEIFIPSPRSYRIHNLGKRFFNSPQKSVFILFGESNVGKTIIMKKFFSTLNSERYIDGKIYINKKTTGRNLHQEIRQNLIKKTSVKIGQNLGLKINIWIEDLNLGQKNQFEVQQTVQLLRFLISNHELYNYEKVKKQVVEDIILIGDAKIRGNDLGINQRFYRHIQPVFLQKFQSGQIKSIFKEMIEKKFQNKDIESVVKIMEKSVNFYEQLKERNYVNENQTNITFMDLQRTVQGFMKWNVVTNQELLQKLFCFQISRSILSKMEKKSFIEQQIFPILQSYFSSFENRLPIFHNLEKNIISLQKCQEVLNLEQFINNIQCICDQYQTLHSQTPSIIVFPEMIQLLMKIYRTLSFDKSHVVLVGPSKCGKKIILKMAIYLVNAELYFVKGKDEKSWMQTIKKCIKECYKSKISSALLIQHRQIKEQHYKSDINRLITTMYLPHIYTQADTEELIYLLQGDLIKNKQTTSKSSMWNFLIPYLQKKLHIVLSVNPTFSNISSDFESYPSFLKYCNVFWFEKWPEEALILISKTQLSDISSKIKILPQIHQIASIITQKKKGMLKNTWEGMYFQFISLVRKVYEANNERLLLKKGRYEKSLNIIEETHNNLEETRNQIKKLQPAIILLQSQTSKTVKNLEIQKKNAKEINEKLENKNYELEKIIIESTILKKEIQKKLDRVQEEMKKAWEVVSNLKPNHISEVKVMANPSELIRIVLTALVVLIHEGPIIRQLKDGAYEDNYFETAKKNILIKDARSICKILTEFKAESVTKEVYWKLKEKCLSYHRWKEKEAKQASKAIYYFFIWVQAVSHNFLIYEETQPLRRQLLRVSQLLREKEVEVAAIRKELVFYQNKIMELEKQHAEKKQTLQEYRFQITKFQRMISRGHDLLKQISSEKEKWINYIGQMDKKLSANYGDTIMQASTIIYMSVHDYEIRTIIKKQIRRLFQENQIQFTNEPFVWSTSRENSEFYQTLEINENEFLMDNLSIIEQASKTKFILDPEEQGIKYIKRQNWHINKLPTQKITQFLPSLHKTIEEAILTGKIICLEIDPSRFNEDLRYIICPKIVGNQFYSGEKVFPIHKNFKIFLYSTSSANKQFSMELLSNVQAINFSITLGQLEKKIMDIVITSEKPYVKSQIEEITRINIKDRISLESIEEKLLTIFSEGRSAEDLLENDEVLATVSHSNRLFAQISLRIKEGQEQKKQIKEEIKQFNKRVRQVCLMYKNLQKLKFMNQFYSFSYEWFIYLFEHNISNFSLVLYQQVSKVMKNNEKQIAAIIIGEVESPELPWRCLFDAGEEKQEFVFQDIGKSQTNLTNLLSSISLELGNLVKGLSVSQQAWNKIVSRVKKAKKYIPPLSSDFLKNCEMFKPLIQSTKQDILEAIPEKYSTLDFYHRILLISCFRPDCVIFLLNDWISINMGSSFINTSQKLASFNENTKPNRPVIMILDDPLIDSVKKIKQIYKQFYKNEEKALSLNNLYWSEKLKQDFDLVIKSGIQQDQWMVLYGLSSEQQMIFIKEYFQDLTTLPEKRFRFWIVIESEIQNSEVFFKFCDKVRITANHDLYKEAASSYFNDLNHSWEESCEYFQKCKKKLMISQICIFHSLLNKKSDYIQQIKPNKSIQSHMHWDLKLTLEQVLGYDVDENCKKVLGEVISYITYGSQVKSEFELQLLKINTEQIIKGIITERGLLWNSIWSDEKFPKQPTEYEHEVKITIQKNKYPQKFNINKKLQFALETRIYDKICLFYNQSSFSQDRGKYQKIMRNLQGAKAQMEKINPQLILSLKEVVEKLKKNKKYKSFYHYLMNEIMTYETIMKVIWSDIQIYIQIPKGNQTQLQYQSFMKAIYNDETPSSWIINKCSRKQNPQIYCHQLNNNLQFLEDFVKGIEQKKSKIQLNCGMILHPCRFLQSLANFYEQKLSQIIFVFSHNHVESESLLGTIKINDLMLWNSEYTEKIGLYCETSNKDTADNYIKVSGYLNLHKGELKKKENYSCIAVYRSMVSELEGWEQPLMKVMMKSKLKKEQLIRKNIHISLKL